MMTIIFQILFMFCSSLFLLPGSLESDQKFQLVNKYLNYREIKQNKCNKTIAIQFLMFIVGCNYLLSVNLTKIIKVQSLKDVYILEGYNITRIRLPMAFGGKFFRNLARTPPDDPCGRVTLPQITRRWLGFS
jgi:hypothetical protein